MYCKRKVSTLLNMHYVQRALDPGLSHDYPLPANAAIAWVQQDDGIWCAQMPLPEIPAQHIIVPSFSAADAATYQVELLVNDVSCSLLPPVPARAKSRAWRCEDAPVTTHIDCWHTTETLTGGCIQFRFTQGRPTTPGLVVVSARSLRIAELSAAEPRPAPQQALNIKMPELISQMQASRHIAQRICSPTALHMALAAVGSRKSSWAGAVRACYDPASGAFGSWPLAIRWAALCGRPAAVEVFEDWTAALTCLAAGTPLVCSINFASGELPGAPLEQTPGHLVVLCGVDAESVYVLDPAAPTHAEVPRRYNLEAFSRAWLQDRGAAYIFAP